MITRTSTGGFAQTLAALLAAIERRGLAVFAQIDHAAGAREAGLELDDEVVVLFGSPRAGTPLMQDDRRVGIELPLRMLVWRDGAAVTLGYLDPHELAAHYDVGRHAQTLEQMASLLDGLAAAAVGGGVAPA